MDKTYKILTDNAEFRCPKLWQLEYLGHIKSPIKRANIVPKHFTDAL